MKIHLVLATLLCIMACGNKKEHTTIKQVEMETNEVTNQEDAQGQTESAVISRDSLLVKRLLTLYPFDLYDKPNGKVIRSFNYDKGFICMAGEIVGDWIRLDYVRANNNKLTLSHFGWTKWRKGNTIVFKIVGERFPFTSPYDSQAIYEPRQCNVSPPEYPGGMSAINKFLAKEVQKRYPPTARQMGIQGGMTVTFIVERDGTMSGFSGPFEDDLMDAAIECVKHLPHRWTPGKIIWGFHDRSVKTVRVRTRVNVTFIL